jgi:UDP-N-acetylmuramoylalanine--D-glutamate ligase
MAFTIVVGLGRSGVGAARLLHHQGQSVVVLERGTGPDQTACAAKLQAEGIQVELGIPLNVNSFEPWRSGLKAVVIGPGIPWDHPTLESLRQNGVQVRGEIELAWDALNHIPWVGITGTNGKTTVTHLLSHVLNHAGVQAPMGGNMGVSAAEMALEIRQGELPKPDWLVMELSSYQIEAAPTLAPSIGVWTTLTPDHLERHGTLEAYRAIKHGLLQRSSVAIFNGDDADLSAHRPSLKRGIWVKASTPCHQDQPADFWIDDAGTVQARQGGAMFPANVLAMPGAHNRQNLLLVTAAATQIGLNAEQIAQGLESFPGVPHRLERLGSMASADVFNDSKATNYDAAAVGLQAMAGTVVVLAGGQTKRGDATGWLTELKSKACAVVLFGAGAKELDELIRQSNYQGQVHCCNDLRAAVSIAVRATSELRASSLLLSPACASFDQYQDFEARGDHFRDLMQPHMRLA